MAYTEGGRIDAADYNQFVSGTNSTNINQVWADTYGQQALPAVSVGQKVFASNWQNFDDTLTKVANHQGTPFEPVGPGGFIPTAQIFPIEGYDIDVAAMIQNQFNAVAVGPLTTGDTSNTSVPDQNTLNTWTINPIEQNFVSREGITWVDYLDSNNVRQFELYTVGLGGTFQRSTNNGQTWTQVVSTTDNLKKIASSRSLQDGVFFAVGTNKALWECDRTAAVASFAKINSSVLPGASNLVYQSVACSGERAVVVGDSGHIMTNYDSFNNPIFWTSRTSGTTNSLRDVIFASQSVIIAVGLNGTILRSANSGSTWTTISSPAGTLSLYGLARHPDLNIIIAVGQSGIILRSTDSGQSWTVVNGGVSPTPTLWCVEWVGDRFIAASRSASRGTEGSWVSTDGSVWSAGPDLMPGFIADRIYDIASPPTNTSSNISYTVAVGDPLFEPVQGIFYSTVGRSYIRRWAYQFVTRFTFESENKARIFFNVGGLIEIRLSKSSTGAPGDIGWNSFAQHTKYLLMSGSSSAHNITGVTVKGATEINNPSGTFPLGGQPFTTLNTDNGWQFLRAMEQMNSLSFYLIAVRTTTPASLAPEYKIEARTTSNGTVLEFRVEVRDYRFSSVSGGTPADGANNGTALNVVARYMPPSTEFLSNSWGNVLVSTTRSDIT